jgi:hypothetical protein
MKRIMVGMAALAAVLMAAPQGAWALGFGAEVGRVQAESGPVGDQRGLFGRVTLIGPLDLQLDYAKATYEGDRDDQRFGAGLRLEPFHLGHWIPALWAGIGVLDVDAPEWQGQLGFSELGLGIVYAFTDNVRVELDLRTGHQDTLVDAKNDTPPMKVVASPGGDDYRSGSLALSIDF